MWSFFFLLFFLILFDYSSPLAIRGFESQDRKHFLILSIYASVAQVRKTMADKTVSGDLEASDNTLF